MPPQRIRHHIRDLDMRLDRMLGKPQTSNDLQAEVRHLNRVLRDVLEHLYGEPVDMEEPRD